MLQAHQPEFFRHAVLRHHGAGDPGRLFNVVGRSGRHGIKHNLLRRAARQQAHQHGVDLFLRIQVLLFFRHLHHIAQGAHGTGHNRNLLHRLRVLLQGADQGMAHLVVGHNPPLLLAHDAVLFLFTYQHHFHRLKQILLRHSLPAILDRQDRRLVDHVRQIRTYGTAGSKGDGLQIHCLIHLHIFGMHLQDIHTAFQIRTVYDNPAVKTAGP